MAETFSDPHFVGVKLHLHPRPSLPIIKVTQQAAKWSNESKYSKLNKL